MAALLAIVSLLGCASLVEASVVFGSEKTPDTQLAQSRGINLPDLRIPPAWPVAENASDGRSLFANLRRAAPTEVAAVAPAPMPEQYLLLAVIVSSSRRIALLKGQQSGQIEQCVEGENIGDWVVRAIEPDHVILEGGGQSATLYLRDSIPNPVN